MIVGAGIAGLTAGWALRDRDVLLLEATERVGGRMRSEARGPYWLNLGAHLFGGPGSLLDQLATETGLETCPIPGNRMALAFRDRLLADGRPETYPFRLPLTWRARLSFIRAGLRLRSATRGYVRAARRRPGESQAQRRSRMLAYRDDQTFSEYLGGLHPDVARIFQAVAERVAAEPGEISAGCGAALFALVWGGGADTLARNLIGGSELLPQALARRLGDRVLTGAVVREVVQTAEGVRVRFSRRGVLVEVSAQLAIVATPAYATREIVQDLPADTADALAWIPYGPFVCGAFLTDEAGPMPWDHIYAIAVADRSFNMLFNHANPLRGPDKREPGGSLMVYAGGDRGRRLLTLTDEQIGELFRRDLHAVLPATRGVVREVLIQRWAHALPYAPPGRACIQPALERSLGRVLLAGDYLEYAEMEAAARSGLEAAQEVRRRLGV
ncbi:MAG TPA: NAD(P)/FAD-dependent oxidoreductase [Methylomirabilota bacterium]|nr:NAD(P)/FAD-dependent oxidoreductase [Methylomirabilota bacterium]